MSSHRVIRLVDNRLVAKSEEAVSYVVKEGAQTVSYVPLTSSSHSTQNTNFNLNNIATNTCRDSRLELITTGTTTLNVTNTDTLPHIVITADNFGFKRWGINNCIQSIQHQINEASYTLNTNDIIDAISRLNSFPKDLNYYDNTQPDLIDSFASATGTLMTPLAPYCNGPAGNGVWKSRTLNWTLANNATNTVLPSATNTLVINWTLTSPLISVFNNISDKDQKGLYAINGEVISINYVTDLWNNLHDFVLPANLTLNSAVVAFTPTCQLNTIYLTPYASLSRELPQNSVYHYNSYTQFTNNVGACLRKTSLNGGAVSSQVCNFTNVPAKILMYCRLANGSRTVATPDKYLTLKNATVQWDNGLPNLQSANTNQFWEISNRNGLEMDRPCFSQSVLNQSLVVASGQPSIYGCGSVLVIDPAIDLSLSNGESTSSAGRYIFQVQQANFVNNTDTDFDSCTLFVVGINQSILERSGSQYRNYLLTLPLDVLSHAKNIDPVSYSEYLESGFDNAFLSGGSVGNFFKKAFNMAKAGVNFGMKHKDDIMKGLDIAKQGYNQIQKLRGKGAIDQHLSNFQNMAPHKNMDLFYE